MSPLQELVLASSHVMQRRILNDKATVTHAVVHSDNGMTGSAGQSCLSFRRVDLLLNGGVETAVEKYRVIMAAGTPFGGLGSDHILHVLDRLPIPLVVE